MSRFGNGGGWMERNYSGTTTNGRIRKTILRLFPVRYLSRNTGEIVEQFSNYRIFFINYFVSRNERDIIWNVRTVPFCLFVHYNQTNTRIQQRTRLSTKLAGQLAKHIWRYDRIFNIIRVCFFFLLKNQE